jgi:hypothetical protein
VVIEKRLMLRVELKALVFEVVTFFENRFKLNGQCIANEFIFYCDFEVFKELNKLINFDLIAFDKLLLVPLNCVLETFVHTVSCLLDVAQQSFNQTFGFLN